MRGQGGRRCVHASARPLHAGALWSTCAPPIPLTPCLCLPPPCSLCAQERPAGGQHHYQHAGQLWPLLTHHWPGRRQHGIHAAEVIGAALPHAHSGIASRHVRASRHACCTHTQGQFGLDCRLPRRAERERAHMPEQLLQLALPAVGLPRSLRAACAPPAGVLQSRGAPAFCAAFCWLQSAAAHAHACPSFA